jgi:hypothetical protein
LAQPNVLQPNVLQPNVLQPNVVQPNVVQSNVVQSNPPPANMGRVNQQLKKELDKKKVLKDLELSNSSSEKSEIKSSINLEPEKNDVNLKKNNYVITKKTLFSNINETVVTIILYIIFSNPYIDLLMVKYIPFLTEKPLIIFTIKLFLFGILYHLINWFMNK